MTERHIVKNEGRHPIIVTFLNGRRQTVDPGATAQGKIIRITHGDVSAHYTVAPLDGEQSAPQKQEV
jgi:hypothetical protein